MSRRHTPVALLAAVAWLFSVALGVVAAADPSAPPPGPPYPAPIAGQAVYDYAGILSNEVIAQAEATIDAIETRTGAEIAIYAQDSGTYPTIEETEAKARALIDQ